MKALEGSIANFAVRMTQDKDLVPYGMTATKEQFNELFDMHDCVVVQYPKDMRLDDYITFYRKSEPERIMYAYPLHFHYNPNKLYRKNYNYAKKHNLVISQPREERAKELRLEKENKLRESMLKEYCILTSSYETSLKPVHYLFENMDYSITQARWNKGVRAHKMKFIHYAHEHIAQLFAKEGCELISQYVNQKSKLTYRYKDREYQVVWNDWKFFNTRPHLHYSQSCK